LKHEIFLDLMTSSLFWLKNDYMLQMNHIISAGKIEIGLFSGKVGLTLLLFELIHSHVCMCQILLNRERYELLLSWILSNQIVFFEFSSFFHVHHTNDTWININCDLVVHMESSTQKFVFVPIHRIKFYIINVEPIWLSDEWTQKSKF